MTGRQRSNPSVLRQTWATAARELGIRVATEDCWLVDDEGRPHSLVAIVHDFGRRRGTAILERWDDCLSALAVAQGFFCTWLSPSYETYDRDLFEATLNDWRWSGDGEPPLWYAGRPWTNAE